MKFISIIILTAVITGCATTKDASCLSGILIGGITGGTAACNKADGDVFKLEQPIADESLIYIYRPYSAILGSSEITVFADNTEIGHLKNRGHIKLNYKAESVSLGFSDPNSLFSKKAKNSIKVPIQKNKAYFVRVEPIIGDIYSDGFNAGATKHLSIELVSQDKAIKEIPDTRVSN